MRTIDDFPMMEPMKYYNNEDDLNLKRQAMLDNQDDLYIATEKHDGDWGMFIHWTKGRNLIRSRSISKVTGVYGDYTAKLPHLVDEMDNWPDNTVVLAEICWNEYGTNANTVGTILRCLPPKAVERQKTKKLYGLVFDMLMFNGQDLTATPYIDRFDMIRDFFGNASYPTGTYFNTTRCFTQDFPQWASNIIAAGGEGLVIQLKSNPYMPGTRTAWKTLKLKQKMDTAEYLVIAALPPKKVYEGDNPDGWKYWTFIDDQGEYFINRDYEEPFYQSAAAAGEALVPVTKPYYWGWKNGITILLPSGIECDVASGLTDADREWLATPEATQQIALHQVWAEVAAMSVNDLGRLRHPYVVRLRTDLNEKGE